MHSGHMADIDLRYYFSLRSRGVLYYRRLSKVTCAEENVASGGMPGHDADPLRVAL